MYFLDYTNAVVAAYHKNISTGNLSTRLVHLTPANVKRECGAVCLERFRKQDERVLRDFFGQNTDKEGYLKVIRKCSIDKFRPVINYINKKSSDTAEANIELLAWLIDFKPRPFESWKTEGAGNNQYEEANTKEEATETGVGNVSAANVYSKGNPTEQLQPANGKDESKK